MCSILFSGVVGATKYIVSIFLINLMEKSLNSQEDNQQLVHHLDQLQAHVEKNY